MKQLPPRRVLTIRGEAVPQVGLLEPLQLEGEEGINRLFEYRLILNTREPDIDLGGLVGRELTCGLELDSPEPAEREISGLITQARYLGEAERHSRVELTLRPWLQQRGKGGEAAGAGGEEGPGREAQPV